MPDEVSPEKYKLPLKQFLQGVFSDNGMPSSSRVLSAILSAGCLLILALVFRHLMYLDAAKLAVWLPNMPLIIGSLAVFAQSPYGLNQVSSIFNRNKVEEKKD